MFNLSVHSVTLSLHLHIAPTLPAITHLCFLGFNASANALTMICSDFGCCDLLIHLSKQTHPTYLPQCHQYFYINLTFCIQEEAQDQIFPISYHWSNQVNIF